MKRLLPLSLLLLAPTVVEAQPCNFRMDYSAAAATRAGWTDVRDDETGIPVLYGTVWTLLRLPNGGPTGQAAYRVSHIGHAGGGPTQGYYQGWRNTTSTPICGVLIPPQGSSIWIYFRFRYVPTNNYQCGAGSCVLKLMQIGEGCTSPPCRGIVQIDGSRTAVGHRFTLQYDGGTGRAQANNNGNNYGPGIWSNVIMELRSATTVTSSDGCNRIWINSNNQATPTVQTCGINSKTGGGNSGWGYIQLGAFANNGNWVSGNVDNYEITDVMYSRTFDSTWYDGGTPLPTPSTPANVRIVQ